MIVSLGALHAQAPLNSYRDFATDDPRRTRPLSLEQQKKRAKELLRAIRAGEADALTRWDRHCSERLERTAFTLSAAQNVLAQEHGFSHWHELKAHIEQASIARAAVAQGNPPSLDADLPTLHIRCGNDIMHGLATAGFSGDFLSFADPLVSGPVLPEDSLQAFCRTRAHHIATTQLNDPAEEARIEAALLRDYEALDSAKNYARVMLWLEHDPYDQLILARLLSYLSDPSRRPPHVQFISIERFPGVERFIGLGQLPPAALRTLWNRFNEVTEAHYAAGTAAWDALVSPTPEKLLALAVSETPALPTLGRALHRHLLELPSTRDGLGLSQRLTLQILAEKPAMRAARLFGWYTNHYEPLPFMGDLQYWEVLAALANAERPALYMDRKNNHPSTGQVALAEIGRSLWAGTTDWMSCKPAVRWLGGVRIDPNAPVWRFDGEKRLELR